MRVRCVFRTAPVARPLGQRARAATHPSFPKWFDPNPEDKCTRCGIKNGPRFGSPGRVGLSSQLPWDQSRAVGEGPRRRDNCLLQAYAVVS